MAKDSKPKAQFDDPTGVCYRHLSWDDNNKIQHRYEVVLVQQSSNLKQDMRRVQTAEESSYQMRNPDMVPFVWRGAWLDNKNFDFTSGPDCSSLPTVVDR